MALPPRPALGASTKATNFDVIEAWMIDVGNKADNALPVKGALGSADLNTITTPGVYYQSNGALATLALNYPAAGRACTVEVFPSAAAAGFVTQEAMVSAGGYVASGKYVRSTTAAGVFSEWRFIPSQRIDTTAGRAFYTWDHVNNREQLLPTSDTGWRQVIAAGDVADMPTLVGYLRRVGYHVTFAVGESAVGSATAGSKTIYTLPSGFRFSPPSTVPSYAVGGLVNPGTGLDIAGGLKVPSITTGQVFLDVNSTARHAGLVSWETLDAWPTSLPGTAAGTIPNL